MKIAIVGAGISGLTCAWLLHRNHDITVYEAEDWIGGHTHTVDVSLPDGDYAVDTGFIVYNDHTYPNFIRLLDQLGLQGQPTRMSFSVHDEIGGLEYCGSSINGLFSQRRNLLRPRFYAMLGEILRFNRDATAVLREKGNPGLADFLEAEGYSADFRDYYLVPMAAAIWSSPLDDIGDFPVQQFLRFFDNHGLLQIRNRPQWRVVPGGSRSYVDKLIQPFADRIRSGCPVAQVSRGAQDVEIRTAQDNERFDHVILACHSDQALALLADPSDAEQEILGAIPYQDNDVVLHTDSRLLPDRRRSIAAWNYRLTGDRSIPATVTYHMNTLQGLDAQQDLCITLNQSERIAPDKVLGRWTYAHPVFNRRSVAAQSRHAEIDGENRTSFCGAYWHNGFHEDGVRSALRVAQRFGGRL